MTHLIPVSSGKDSEATAIWFSIHMLPVMEQLGQSVQLIFCDTGHEADVSYDFLEKVFAPALPEQMRDLRILKNKRGETLLEQASRKGTFPSLKRRFCTSDLKVKPMIDHILSFNTDVTIYDGRRHQESAQRSGLKKKDDYFDEYFTRQKRSPYRAKDVRKWCETHTAYVIRPILTMSAKEVFEFITQAGYTRNPLYDLGFNRVGCFPCILASFGEIARIAEMEPARIDAIRQVEQDRGTTFFGPDRIPVRFCKNQIKKIVERDVEIRFLNDNGEVETRIETISETKLVGAPTIDEVVAYANTRRHDDGLFRGTCQNRYVNCE